MNKEATQILINEVYEKHFNHYKDEFGKTIIGFFSDEPRFGNIKGTTASIGREKMRYLGMMKFIKNYKISKVIKIQI
ncbi:MAG: hypothetical protein ACLSBH_06065 [Coprobacillus cateniformis]